MESLSPSAPAKSMAANIDPRLDEVQGIDLTVIRKEIESWFWMFDTTQMGMMEVMSDVEKVSAVLAVICLRFNL